MSIPANHGDREKGQALVIVAFAIVTLVAFVGLGIDLGLAYVERVRIQRAADAAALAAAAELPLDAAAKLRALEYLSENQYDCGLTLDGGIVQCKDPTVYVKVGGNENFTDPTESSRTRIIIDVTESSSRVRVQLTRRVDLYFMRLLGFNDVPVYGRATAENIQDLDIVLVFDKSGSMEFDTLCYGCWTPGKNKEYPDGERWPLRWDGPPDGLPYHCSGDGAPLTTKVGGINRTFIAIEAEEYSAYSNDYHRDTSPGQGYTYWVMQRNGKVTVSDSGYLGDAGAWGRDTQGAYIAHFPYRSGYNGASDGSGVPCYWDDVSNGRICRRGTWITNRGGPYPAPRMDYDFTVPATGDWYIWIRAQGGDNGGDPHGGRAVFWGLTSSDGTYNNTLIGLSDGNPSKNIKYPRGWTYNGAKANAWTWGRLGTGKGNDAPFGRQLKAGETYTLHLWAGSVGFAVDRIIITDYNGNQLPDAATKSAIPLDNNRTRLACDPCDARFGGYPGGLGNTSADGDDPPNCDSPDLNADARYRYLDDLFDDEQPMASTAAAAVRFIRKLDYDFDQIGLVRYDTKADPAVELLCLKSHGEGCTKNVIDNTIIDALMNRNQTHASGSTNIADGLEEAIEMLDHTPPHRGRPGAASIIILMTDGQPNQYGNLRNENKNCYVKDLWPGDSRAHDCSMYFAEKARDNGIIIYGITLGDGADKELLAGISELTGGVHLHAESPDRLDDIFDELYSRIFLRLVE